jgi:fatty acid desaturase
MRLNGQPEACGAERHLINAKTPVKLAKKDLLALSKVNPCISAYHILIEWGLIILGAALCQRFWNPVTYLLAVAFIGARQHALLILMHDGTHYRLFRNRALNDWVTEILLAWPHLVTMRTYRENHLAHHNFVNTDQDPDWLRKKDHPEWHFPQSPMSLLRLFIRDLTGVGGINLIRLASSLSSGASAPSNAYRRAKLAFYLGAIGGIIALHGEKAVILYWIIPYFSWLIFVMHVRSIAEHFAIGRAGQYGQTRTTGIGLLARIFVAPKNVNYHIEHHFFPSVPFFRLPQLHALLMSNAEFAEGAHITRNYFEVIRECLGWSQPTTISAAWAGGIVGLTDDASPVSSR